jgi:sugar lactone lactonase YvrE
LSGGQVELVVPARAQLGECPLWSPADERLYWVDIDGRAIHRFDPATRHDELRPLPARPGSIALTSVPGRLLVAAERRLAFFDWAADSWHDWMTLEPDGVGNRLNDGRCDPAGRFWVGSMFDPAAAGRSTGMLHRIEPDGAAVTIRVDIGVANGLAFSPDGRTMYFADTLRATVWAYDYEVATGRATNERVFLDFEGLPGRPDGACVDEEGGYWIACISGSMVIRATPDGTIDRRITLPVAKPTMPAFGGPNLTTLYVTTIGGGGSHPRDRDEPDAGALFAIEPGVRGLPEPQFGRPAAMSAQ